MERKQRCETCRFWDGKTGDTGQCLRFPPQLIGNEKEAFPLTGKCCWCGEWQEKEVEALEENLDAVCQGYLELALKRAWQREYIIGS